MNNNCSPCGLLSAYRNDKFEESFEKAKNCFGEPLYIVKRNIKDHAPYMLMTENYNQASKQYYEDLRAFGVAV